MTAKTDELIRRALAWQEDDSAVLGIVVYGSAAHGRTHELSDVDLVVVMATGTREKAWIDRQAIAERLLDDVISYAHDLPWQGDYRYQAWRSDLLGVDLTFDEGRLEPHEVFATGEPKVLVGDVIIPTQPRADPVARAEELDGETWVWFLGIHNQLHQGRTWDAYVQFTTLLDSRMTNLLPVTAVVDLVPRDMGSETLLRQLRQAIRAYDDARLARGLGPSTFPLADTIRAAVTGSGGAGRHKRDR